MHGLHSDGQVCRRDRATDEFPSFFLPQMTKKVLCMNPGPIEFEQRVLKEFSAEGISHVDKSVIEVFGQALEKMRKVFLAPDGQPLVVAGSGTLGWDMVGANLVNQGDHVLVVNTGT